VAERPAGLAADPPPRQPRPLVADRHGRELGRRSRPSVQHLPLSLSSPRAGTRGRRWLAPVLGRLPDRELRDQNSPLPQRISLPRGRRPAVVPVASLPYALIPGSGRAWREGGRWRTHARWCGRPGEDWAAGQRPAQIRPENRAARREAETKNRA